MGDASGDKETVTGGRRALDHQVADLVNELRGAVFGYQGDHRTGLLNRVGQIEDGHHEIKQELSGLRSGIRVGVFVLGLFIPVLTTLGVVVAS